MAPHVRHLQPAREPTKAEERGLGRLPFVFVFESRHEAQGNAVRDAHFFTQLPARIVVIAAQINVGVRRIEDAQRCVRAPPQPTLRQLITRHWSLVWRCGSSKDGNQPLAGLNTASRSSV
jgi:hypothetical protein